jgi:hypothetical protein
MHVFKVSAKTNEGLEGYLQWIAEMSSDLLGKRDTVDANIQGCI